MKILYISVILSLLVLTGCKEPSPHDKSLKEIYDLKKMGDEIERNNDKLRESNKRDIIDKEM